MKATHTKQIHPMTMIAQNINLIAQKSTHTTPPKSNRRMMEDKKAARRMAKSIAILTYGRLLYIHILLIPSISVSPPKFLNRCHSSIAIDK